MLAIPVGVWCALRFGVSLIIKEVNYLFHVPTGHEQIVFIINIKSFMTWRDEGTFPNSLAYFFLGPLRGGNPVF